MKQIINDVEICYRIEGEGKSKVVLLHGWGCSMKLMQPVCDALKTDHQVLMIDFPGHGESGSPPKPWGIPEYAACLLNLLKRLSFDSCSLIAHSFGCRVATWIESEYPGTFSKMIFTGAAGIRPKPTEKGNRRNARYKKLKQYCESVKKIPFLTKTATGWEEKLRQKYGSRDYNALDEEMRKTFVKVINLDLTNCYERFRASTLLIWGDKDTETPLWMAKEMEKRIPDAGLVILEGGTHFAYLEQIGRFNMISQQFLKEDE